MPEIELPDGSVANFPDGMTDTEIKAILRKRFPPPRPESLQPGETHKRPNGAAVSFNAMMNRYVVQNSQGRPSGFRLTLDAAIGFADTIQPPPPPRAKPKPTPQPDPQFPLAAEREIAADVERADRNRRSREHSERVAERRQRRYRNRGTLG